MNKKIVSNSFLNALGTVVYVSLVVLVMNKSEHAFGPGNNLLMGVAVLSLFVLSAAIVGALVLGRPILWYLEGKKSEGIKLFLYTLAWLFVFVLIIFIVLASLPKTAADYLPRQS